MKRKSYGGDAVKLIKTSITVPEVLAKFVEERCREEGFNSFSAYLAHLLRSAKEKHEEKQLALGQYPAPAAQLMRVEEKPSSPPASASKKGKSDKGLTSDQEKGLLKSLKHEGPAK